MRLRNRDLHRNRMFLDYEDTDNPAVVIHRSIIPAQQEYESDQQSTRTSEYSLSPLTCQLSK